MQLTKKCRNVILKKSLLALAALSIAFGAPIPEASALESTGTTGVFVSFADYEETAGKTDAGESAETPAEDDGQKQGVLPKTGDETMPAIVIAFGTMTVCLAIGLIALKARKKRRIDGCEQTRLLAIAMAFILAAGCTPPFLANAQAATAPFPESDAQSASTAQSPIPLAAQGTAFSEGWTWQDCLFMVYGMPNVREEVSVAMMPLSPPPSGFSPEFEWGYVNAKTGEETIFAFGTKATVPWEAFGNNLFFRVSDQSGIVHGSYKLGLAGYVGLPILKGTVELEGALEIGSVLKASVALETADASPLYFRWYTGESEGSCSTLVAEGIQADELILDDPMRGLYVTCVISSNNAESYCGTIQASSGPVPKEPLSGTVSIEGERRLGATLSASVSECPVEDGSISIEWYVGDLPGSMEERIGEGWSLELDDPSWEGRYLVCTAKAKSIRYEGFLAASDDTPIVFKPPEAPAIEAVSVNANAHIELSVAWTQDDPFAPTEALRIEACSPEGEWHEIGSFAAEESVLECEIPIPEIAEWGSVLVRAVALNSGGSRPSEESRVTAQMSIAVPVGIEGKVDENGNASFSPQRIENTGSLNVRIAEVSTVLADSDLGLSRWTCHDGNVVMFDGEFGSAQACPNSRTLAPGESCELIWHMSGYHGGQVSLGSNPVLYGTIGYTFRLP